MILAKFLSLIVLTVSLTIAVHCQEFECSDLEKLTNYLNAIRQKKGFNGEMLIAKGKNVLFQETVGLSSYENNLELKKKAFCERGQHRLNRGLP